MFLHTVVFLGLSQWTELAIYEAQVDLDNEEDGDDHQQYESVDLVPHSITCIVPVGHQDPNTAPDKDRVHREDVAKVRLANSHLENKVSYYYGQENRQSYGGTVCFTRISKV